MGANKTKSLDLRRQVVAAYESGLSGTYAQTAVLFGVGRATVNRWLRRKRQSGDVKPLPRPGNNPRRVDLNWLRAHAQQHPDARLVDRVQAWQAHGGMRVHIATMSKAMRTIGWTYKKKTPMARERERPDVIAKRDAFKAEQPAFEPAKLVFVDESGFRLGGTPRYGWAQRGCDAPGSHVQGKWESVTMVGAVALDGFRGFMTVDSATSNDVFMAFVSHQLVPRLNHGDIVVMDNLTAHKSKPVIEAIEQAGASVVFTPPYSPEYNPIEKTWAKPKDFIRRLPTLSREAFDKAICAAMAAITAADIKGWVRHAGYAVN